MKTTEDAKPTTIAGATALTAALIALAPYGAQAYQPDAPFLDYQARNQGAWAEQDKSIDEKLAALEQKFGKKPNIIYILTDDIGWGELGWQGGGKHRGTPTPTLDRMAKEGMRFWSAYAEPSCTPTRIAINTGRHPVRTGLLSVLWPGQTDGLPAAEVTIAELLSEAGYHTAMWGKWHQDDPGVDKANAQASMMVLHNQHVDRLLNTLEKEGIAENTLVVWWSDNGPMYAFYPTSGYTLLRGAKGDVLEGGVRVPGMAYWPGMIEPDQDPNDMIHVTDLFTTAARIAGIKDQIPGDRVTDGIDQSALFLLGEGNGRRNYMTHYSGPELGAIRYEDFKVHIKPAHGGLPGMDFYNIMRDPGEKYGKGKGDATLF